MKRAPIVLSATVAGVAATLGFHAHTATAPIASASAAGSATTSASTGAASSSSSTPSSSTASAASTASGSSHTSTTASTRGSTKTVTSDPVSNQYGVVQLKVTVRSGKITDVSAVQLPTNDPKSAEINAYAAPLLRESTLTAQSAQIDSVSGATFTSESYKTALQSALDQVTLTAGASAS